MFHILLGFSTNRGQNLPGLVLVQPEVEMLYENNDTLIIVDENALVDRFAAWVRTLGPLPQASLALQAIIMEEIKIIAENLDAGCETGRKSYYVRRVLYEDPDVWSLAAIILQPGQQTHPHNHGGWGCAVTVQGAERDRRYIRDEATGDLVLISMRDYPRGTGYYFDDQDIHQPVGAAPDQVTVSLHFLVH